MALYHKWDVKNGFTYVLTPFSLISKGLGGVTGNQGVPPKFFSRYIPDSHKQVEMYIHNLENKILTLAYCSNKFPQGTSIALRHPFFEKKQWCEEKIKNIFSEFSDFFFSIKYSKT